MIKYRFSVNYGYYYVQKALIALSIIISFFSFIGHAFSQSLSSTIDKNTCDLIAISQSPCLPVSEHRVPTNVLDSIIGKVIKTDMLNDSVRQNEILCSAFRDNPNSSEIKAIILFALSVRNYNLSNHDKVLAFTDRCESCVDIDVMNIKNRCLYFKMLSSRFLGDDQSSLDIADSLISDTLGGMDDVKRDYVLLALVQKASMAMEQSKDIEVVRLCQEVLDLATPTDYYHKSSAYSMLLEVYRGFAADSIVAPLQDSVLYYLLKNESPKDSLRAFIYACRFAKDTVELDSIKMEALDIANRTGFVFDMITIYYFYAYNYLKLAPHSAESEKVLRLVIENYDFRKIHNMAIISSYALLAEILNEDGRSSESIPYALEAYELGKEQGDPYHMEWASSELTKAYDRMGNLKEAYFFLGERDRIRDSNEVHGNFSSLMAEFKDYQFSKEKEILQLKKEREAQLATLEIKRQKRIQQWILFGMLVSSLLAFSFYRNYKLKKRAEVELQFSNDSLAAQTSSLREANTKLKRINRGITHDIIGGLNRMRNMGRHQIGPKSTTKDYLNYFVQQNKMSASLISYCHELLSDSNKPIDLKNVIQMSLEQFDYEIERKNAEVQVEVSAELPLPAEGIRQVITNVVDNAIYYIPSDGTGKIIIKAINDPSGEKQLLIENNGPAIELDNIQDVFDQNYSSKPDGLGLGLSIVDEIIRSSGGSSFVESGPWGTRFTFRWPLV